MFRRAGIVSMICLTAYLLSGATAPQSCNTNNSNFSVGPSTGQVVGAAVAVVAVITVGTVVLVEVHNAHHTIRGCVLAGPSGLQVQDRNNQKLYDVSGATANVKVGDQVRLHGSKEKKAKGATTQTFVVEKLNKDYGPCPALPAQLAAAPTTPTP